jgi:hypothetical protein
MSKHRTPKSIRQVASLHVTTNRFGYRGIEWSKDKGKFRARIFRGSGRGQRHSLGYFKTATHAASAYDAAAREEYGQRAALNFPLDLERRVVPSKLSDGLCPRGHDLHVFGYLAPDGRQNCRKCNAAAQARYKTRKRKRAAEGA